MHRVAAAGVNYMHYYFSNVIKYFGLIFGSQEMKKFSILTVEYTCVLSMTF